MKKVLLFLLMAITVIPVAVLPIKSEASVIDYAHYYDFKGYTPLGKLDVVRYNTSDDQRAVTIVYEDDGVIGTVSDNMFAREYFENTIFHREDMVDLVKFSNEFTKEAFWVQAVNSGKTSKYGIVTVAILLRDWSPFAGKGDAIQIVQYNEFVNGVPVVGPIHVNTLRNYFSDDLPTGHAWGSQEQAEHWGEGTYLESIRGFR